MLIQLPSMAVTPSGRGRPSTPPSDPSRSPGTVACQSRMAPPALVLPSPATRCGGTSRPSSTEAASWTGPRASHAASERAWDRTASCASPKRRKVSNDLRLIFSENHPRKTAKTAKNRVVSAENREIREDPRDDLRRRLNQYGSYEDLLAV